MSLKDSLEKILFDKYFLFVSFLFLYMPSRIVSMVPNYIKMPVKLFIIFIILLYYFIEYIKKIKLDLYIFIYLLIAIVTVFVTFLNGGYYLSAIYNDTLIILSLIILIYLSLNKDFFLCLKIFSNYCFCIIVLNFIVEFIFEIILDYNWTQVCIFGNSNVNFDYFYYFFVLQSILFYLNKNKNDLIVLIIGSGLCLFDGKFHNCHTTNICMIALIIGFIIINYNFLYLKLFNILNPYISLFINVIFYLFFILEFNGVNIGQKVSSLFLNGMTDFNGRMILWKFGIDSIFAKPFGHGLATERNIQGVQSKLSTFHHTFIHVGYEIGFLGMFLVIALLLLVCYSINKITNNKLKFYLSIVFLMLLLRFQMSSDAKACFYSFLAFLYFISPLLNRYKYYEIVR